VRATETPKLDDDADVNVDKLPAQPPGTE